MDENTKESGVANYIRNLVMAVQKRAEGVPFAKTVASVGDDFVRCCQVAGYGMLSILKKGSAAVGKADVMSPLFRLIANAMAMTLPGISGAEKCRIGLLKMQVSISY